MEGIKLIAEKKFIEVEKCICAKRSYRQEYLRIEEDKSINVYRTLHNYNGILSK